MERKEAQSPSIHVKKEAASGPSVGGSRGGGRATEKQNDGSRKLSSLERDTNAKGACVCAAEVAGRADCSVAQTFETD